MRKPAPSIKSRFALRVAACLVAMIAAMLPFEAARTATGDATPPPPPPPPSPSASPSTAGVADAARIVTPEVIQAVEAMKAGNAARAAAFLRPAAENGDPDAQALLGQLYLEGSGLERDLVEAGRWLRAAAGNGQPEGTYLLATAVEVGLLTVPGMAENDAAARMAEAARLYIAAATSGSLPAMVEAGLRYARGDGVAKDTLAASRWFREAARQGSADAQFNLGALHAAGELAGGAPDHAAAVPWFEQAAARGHTDAQYNLGLIAAQGLAGEVDNAAAVRWFEAASTAGLADARAGLAWLVYHGLGTEKDEARAAALYGQAADQGHPIARNRLARLLIMGRGIEQDFVEAYKWHLLARADGLADEDLEARFASLLDAQARAAGEARADEWRAARETSAP